MQREFGYTHTTGKRAQDFALFAPPQEGSKKYRGPMVAKSLKNLLLYLSKPEHDQIYHRIVEVLPEFESLMLWQLDKKNKRKILVTKKRPEMQAPRRISSRSHKKRAVNVSMEGWAKSQLQKRPIRTPNPELPCSKKRRKNNSSSSSSSASDVVEEFETELILKGKVVEDDKGKDENIKLISKGDDYGIFLKTLPSGEEIKVLEI